MAKNTKIVGSIVDEMYAFEGDRERLDRMTADLTLRAQASAAEAIELALEAFVLASGAAPEDCHAVYDTNGRLVAVGLKSFLTHGTASAPRG